MSKFEALNAMMFQFGVGMNMFVYGRNATDRSGSSDCAT